MTNLIEIYIHEVTRRLPEKSRGDIALELKSTIEDMLPDDYTEEDVKEVLQKLGSPVALAAGYRDQPMHLIGPRYFDVYMTLLKMILPISVVIALISMIAVYSIHYNGDDSVLSVILFVTGQGVWKVIEVGIQVFFWLTVVFAIIERTDKGKDMEPLTSGLTKWTPEDLKNIPYIPKKRAISKLEVFGYLMWTAIWAAFYFYADYLIGIYENNGNGLEFIQPVFNQDVLIGYWPIVIVIIGLEIALAVYKFIKGQWTKRVAVFNTVVEVLASATFILIFSNPKLVHPEFIVYMSDLFSVSDTQFKGWLLAVLFLTVVIFSVISIIDGFRKARIKSS